MLRKVLIEYTPNYFIVDHIPKLLSEGFAKTYPLKFIVSLREPVNRTLSSWRFKAHENYVAQEKMVAKGRVEPIEISNLEDSIGWGKRRGECISKCYKRNEGDMKKCNMNKCRKKYDLMSKETQLFAALEDQSAFCCRTAYYAHVTKSLYAYQFAKWFSYFDKSQFFVFTIEEFTRNRIGVIERLLDFLGLPLYDPGRGKYGYKGKEELKAILSMVINKTPRKIVFENQITPAVEKELKDFFSPHNEELKKVLGFDPGYK
jgi:Sulfotransferase domain